LSFVPLRIPPGVDLRKTLNEHVFANGTRSGFVVAGIGSLVNPRVRLANASDELTVAGPAEILSLSGSLSEQGAHIHIAVANAQGQVVGGHLAYGSIVHTTVELLLAQVPGYVLTRSPDSSTGYLELVVGRSPPASDSAA